MAGTSKPYQVDWNEPSVTVEELDARLGARLQLVDEMLSDLYVRLAALEARVVVLEEA